MQARAAHRASDADVEPPADIGSLTWPLRAGQTARRHGEFARDRHRCPAGSRAGPAARAAARGYVTRRYDANKPILLSTNKAFNDWAEVFPHAACTVTLVDRLVHRSEILEIDGDSYRLKEAKERQLTRSSSRRSKKPEP